MTLVTLKRIALFAVMGTMATGCATTKVTTKTAKAAPITYKIGQGSAQFASLDRSDSSRAALPRFDTSPRAIDPLGAQGYTFDPSRIDRQLYSHQKVGQRYTIMGRSYTPKHDPDYDRVGEASWYGPKFHGKLTANGETFDKRAMTAAHKTLPLNSMVVVTNLENGRVITLRLNDRGPFIGDRIIDLSEAAAEVLGFKNNGLARVRVQYAGPADPMAADHVLPRSAPRVAELPKENLIEAPKPKDDCHELNVNVVIKASCLNDYPAVPDYSSPYTAAPITPSAPRRAPEADLPNGDITLTIKGPIHIARADDTDAKPKFIAERIQTK